ncbi:MAG TPA: hypothetical protein VGX25_04450 [Actinophytocola sp.]|uniref:hypothetical protein n=1 Tax=Actinophytocola sp. TaxID=1872138 RepID=UPI002DDD729C|nr:hypothetical protein [Actinophytocola sp.]HEV2778631.1 hypothetical protein [Actinophytocola sp.]
MRPNIVRRGVAAALLGAGAAALAANPAGADPVGVASGCIITITQVQALDLQESSKDEVYFTLGGTRYPNGGAEVPFTYLATHPGADFDSPSVFVPAGGYTTLSGFEADWPSADDSLGSARLTCTSSSPVDLVTSYSRYRVWFGITAV